MKRKIDVVQIWIENPKAPNQKLMKWMKGIVDQKQHYSTYTLISSNNYFKDDKSVRWIFEGDVVKSMRDNNVIVDKIYDKLSVEQKSELLRTYVCMVSKKHNFIYFDCDIELKKWPMIPQNTNKSIFVKRSNSTFDNHCFYMNNNNDTMRLFFNKIVESMNRSLIRNKKITYSNTYLTINQLSSNIVTIDDSFITHHFKE